MENYYEIYIQKEHRGQKKFCLRQKGSLFKTPGPYKEEQPLLEFMDVDRDGVPDITFYYNGRVFVYYNKHSAKPFQGGLGYSNLCKSASEVQDLPFF